MKRILCLWPADCRHRRKLENERQQKQRRPSAGLYSPFINWLILLWLSERHVSRLRIKNRLPNSSAGLFHAKPEVLGHPPGNVLPIGCFGSRASITALTRAKTAAVSIVWIIKLRSASDLVWSVAILLMLASSAVISVPVVFLAAMLALMAA